MINILKLSILSLFGLILCACQPNLNSNTYGYSYYYGAGADVREGVIQDIQYNVVVQAPNTGTGAVVGGLTGAVVGSSFGGNGIGGLIGTLGGAVVGSMAGNAIEQNNNTAQGILYIVRLAPRGRLISIIQNDSAPLCVGDHVYVIMDAQNPKIHLNEVYYNNPAHTREGCFKR